MFGSNNKPSASAPSNSLFSFGANKPIGSNSSSLFGNNNNSNNNNNQNSSFLNNTNNNNNNNSSNKSSLFGNGFNNTNNNINNNNPEINNTKSATLDDSPFGINLSFDRISEMPKSITDSKETNNVSILDNISSVSSPRTKSKKKNSVSSSSHKLYNSSILNGIRNSKSNHNKSLDLFNTSTQGIFIPAKDNLILNLNPEQDSKFSSTLTQQYSTKTFDFASDGYKFNSGLAQDIRNNVQQSKFSGRQSDIKKLIIDPDASAAKRRRLLYGSRSLKNRDDLDFDMNDTQERILESGEVTKKRLYTKSSNLIISTFIDSNDRPIANAKKLSKSQIDHNDKIEIDESKPNEEESFDFDTNPKGYWCAPGLDSLSKMTLGELSSVNNFIIGRKDFGQIAFCSAVDLVDLATKQPQLSTKANLYNSLMTDTVVKVERKFVKVYIDDDIANKPPMGQGMNVPAIITLEGLYPGNSNSNENVKPKDFQKFVAKLQRQKEMEFITYVAGTGSWTFKVPHFSIWGLIDDESDNEDDNDSEEISHEKKVSETKELSSTEEIKKMGTSVSKNKNEPSLKSTNSSIIITKRKPEIAPHVDENDKFALKRMRMAGSKIPGGWAFDETVNVDDFSESEEEEPENVEVVDEEVVNLEIDKDSNNSSVETPGEIEMTNVEDEEVSVNHKQLVNINDIDNESFEEIIKHAGNNYEIMEKLKNTLIVTEEDEVSITEKAYEPMNINKEDYKFLEVNPLNKEKNVTKLNWKEVFHLTKTSSDSVFNPKVQETVYNSIPKYPYAIVKANTKQSLGFNELDDLLFDNINSMILSHQKAVKELRLEGKNFVKWDTNNSKLYSNINVKKGAIVFHDLTKQYGGNQFPLSTSDFYKIHFNCTEINYRENGLPKIKELSLKFQDLKDNSKGEESKLWDLASRLFDIDSEAFKGEYSKLQNRYDEEIVEYLMERNRFEVVKDWLEKFTIKDANKLISNYKKIQEDSDDPEEVIYNEIFLNLCCNQITKANSLACSTKNFYLATLISLFGSNNENVKYGAVQQLKYWKENSFNNYISPSLIKIYKLLTGDFLDEQDVIENLSWKLIYSMIISFGDVNKTLGELTKEFFDNYIIPKKIKIDNELAILKIYYILNGYSIEIKSEDIDFATNSLENSTNNLNVRIQWYITQILFARNEDFSENRQADKLSLLFAEQLMSVGDWEYTLFVLIHLNDDEIAKKMILEHISKNIFKFTDLNYENFTKNEKINSIINDYLVPKKYIASAIALAYHYKEDYHGEAMALITAESWYEAHHIILSRLAPISIINDGKCLENLLNLITMIPKEASDEFGIEEWAKGLGVYKNYLVLKSEIDLNEKLIDSLINNLIIHLPLVHIYNSQTKIAVEIMSNFTMKYRKDL